MASGRRRTHTARVWARALVVVGGAVAGSAVAWALSTSSAAADDQGIGPDTVKDTASAAGHAVKSGVDKAGEHLRGHAPESDGESSGKADGAGTGDRTTEGEDIARDDAVGDSVDKVRTQVDDFLHPDYDYDQPGPRRPGFDELRERIEKWFDSELPDLENQVPETPWDELPETGDQSPDSVAPVYPSDQDTADPGERARSAERFAATAIPASDSPTSQRGSPAPLVHDGGDDISNGAGSLVPAGAPMAPISSPGSSMGAAAADGQPLAVTSNVGNADDAANAAKVLPGASFAPFAPGRQPGVTPD